MNLIESIVNAIARANQKVETIKALHLELDYQLSWLHEYMEKDDQNNIQITKGRLSQIHQELTQFKVF
ncbi:hypothetical protein [Rummeliibacillus sp. TYF-LIM-RU47]|uniref:hypothetical protein n=1 Tax=Rummeliibacillus sp. TYF-LIM-RU47 TaxID=2608406 RepID=UPI0012387667|nr:hypothetical protein [Rummeliibacillus sp. TYF-LIM-RU47]